jgi:tetratricopeptide (TPR) repeat protein
MKIAVEPVAPAGADAASAPKSRLWIRAVPELPRNLPALPAEQPLAGPPKTIEALQGTPLAPPPAAARSEQMENLAVQADRRTEHAFELAGRGAYFAARAECISALRLIAQGLDAEEQTTVHGRALSAGLAAIKESQDFVPRGSKLEADLDLTAVVGSHRTPVLKNVPAAQLRSLSAMKCYLVFAQEQLAVAAGHEVAGSMALRALGKIHAALAQDGAGDVVAAEPKAVVFFQAALIVYPYNYMASNDVGVLLARYGDYANARRALEHSVSIYQGAANLGNLAAVYQQLGRPDWAGIARQQAQAAGRAEAARLKNLRQSSNGLVEWVDPPQLANSAAAATYPASPKATTKQ